MKHKKRNRGVVLLAAFLVLIGLSVIAICVTSAAVHQVTQADLELSIARSRAASDAGIYDAIRLLAETRGAPTGVTGYTFPFANQDIDILITPEIGKVDLNTSDPRWIALLFGFYGVDQQLAFGLAQDIVTARQRANGGFVAVSQLQNLRGVTPSIYHCIESHLTVYSRRIGPDFGFSDGKLRDAVQWAIARNWGDIDWQQFASESTETNSVLDQNRTTTGESFRITATAHLAANQAVSRQATILITGDLQEPVWIYRWTDYRQRNRQCATPRDPE